MVDVAKKEGSRTTMGQSPFALQRGQRFESRLVRDDAKILRDELERVGVLPAGIERVSRDFRMRHLGGTTSDLDDARQQTTDFLRALAKSGRLTQTVVSAATICVPGRAMLPEAILVLDVLVVRQGTERPELVVGEVKTYPDRGGHTDRIELAGARAQAGVYVHGLREVLREQELRGKIDVSDVGFLVLTKPGSNRVSVRANEQLRYQASRAERGLEKLRALAATHATKMPSNPIAAVQAAPVHYSEACVRFCDRADRCHTNAVQAGDAAILGDEMAALIGSIPLDRACALLSGAKPRNDAERNLAVRLEALQ